ncbi:MAG: DEAD/DEAH box helicase [Armatimonadetes bacterium]|nr:DEAD/DEAH box helicase [Armatimonadota bacterium]
MTAHPALAAFHEPVQRWFTEAFGAPTRAQELAWPAIQSGGHTLLIAPTGSGKTLSAFLSAIDHVMFEAAPPQECRCRVLYVSPLKALAVDIERNLRVPIAGVADICVRERIPFHMPALAVRTGDTPSKERAQFARKPADFLITTPESLYLILTSNARETLRSVRWVIVDEIHALAPTKRGSHLALSLERLEDRVWGDCEPALSGGTSATARGCERPTRQGEGRSGLPRCAHETQPDQVGRETLRSVLSPCVPSVPLVPSPAATDAGGTPALREAAHAVPNHEGRTTRNDAEGDTTLSRRSKHAFQRIGLSATVRPLGEVARFLGGYDDDGSARPVIIADAGSRKELDLRVELAVADVRAARARARPVVERVGAAQVGTPSRKSPKGSTDDGPPERGLWPAVHPMLLDLIRAHRSTLIFVNNRRLAERMAAALNELAGSEIVQAHHGSIAREQRMQIEEALKEGKLPALIATSSLELGIDMGAIDLVIQIESPPSVASAMQRIGRAGHQVGAPSKGVIVPKHRGDLLACAAVTERMHEGAVETIRYPRNPLDVLAQQVVAMVAMGDPAQRGATAASVRDVERTVRRAAPYADLAPDLLRDVLDMLSGRYPSHDFTDLRPRITWDRATDTLTPREGARRVAVGSGGTIPDRGLYGVFLAGAPKGKGRVGELEEIMVFESRVGDVFLLGASSWRILDISHDKVTVAPAPGVPGRMPFWHGENVGRSLELGRAIGALTRRIGELPEDDAVRMLEERHDLTRAAASDLIEYLDRQRQAAGVVPDDRTIVVERHRDEMGEWRVCILSPFGTRIHAPWAMAIGATIRDAVGIEPDLLWTDNGIVLRYPDADQPPPTAWLLPDADTVQQLVVRQLAFGGGAARHVTQGAPVTAVFASRFREAASRALLLPQRRPGKRSPLWQTRKRAADLLHVVARYRDFPIVLETYRECLQDVFDMAGLVEIMAQVADGTVRVIEADTLTPSPFAASLLFSYVGNFMYEGDAPLAERRAQALSIDPVRLRQLLGEAELRELLDADVLVEIERELQCLSEGTRARSADAMHDMLLRLGDLGADELSERVEPRGMADTWLPELDRAHRAVAVSISGEARWIAAEDAGLYRDALGVAPPAEAPEAFLTPVDDALGQLTARYARRRGPFRLTDFAARYGIGSSAARMACEALAADDRIVEGEFTPDRVGLEWCDAGVLRMLRSRTLARLRHEVEPVTQGTLVRFALDWHGVTQLDTTIGNASERLLHAIRQLQGVAVPASALERDVLRARIPDYDSRDLDLLLASGSVVWVGAGPIGEHDGRLRLLVAADVCAASGGPARWTPGSRGEPPQVSDRAAQVLSHLQASGACFFPAIVQSISGFPPDVLEAIWELVWAGLVTNDTLQPVRHFVEPGSSRRVEEYARRRAGRFRPIPHAQTIGGRPIPATAGGRWSVVPDTDDGASATDMAAFWTEQLLERHGVLTREAVVAEGLEGGFTPIYDVLKALEDAGRIRRGYFVEGLGATQFALPEAVERLRSFRLDRSDLSDLSDASDGSDRSDVSAPSLLASCDPANPYGAALPWPEHRDARRPSRGAGAYVVIADGRLIAWFSRIEERLIIFDEADASVAAVGRSLVEGVAEGRMSPFTIRQLNGDPASSTPYAPLLEASGTIRSGRGLVVRR